MSKKPGLNLADLAPLSEDVPVGENFLTVHGISAEAGLEIFKRFPKVVNLISGQGFDIATFLSVAPGAVAAIIAAAAGELNNEDAEKSAASLGIETQFDILEAIGRLTFTRGFAPFAERIMALVGANSVPSGKVTDTKSPPASKPSSPPDTPQA